VMDVIAGLGVDAEDVVVVQGVEDAPSLAP
jgi:hypothetical protein